MKLAVLNLTAGGMSGGYKKYMYYLLKRLSSNAVITEILCTVPTSSQTNQSVDYNSHTKSIEVRPYSVINHKLNRELRVILDEFSPDIVYVPIERFFSYEKAPIVMMLQNMEPFVYPFSGNPLSEKLKNILRIANTRKALRRADRIIAISEFVQDLLITKMCIHPEKIGLVYHGIEKKVEDPERPASVPATCEKFLFTAGSIRPARGLEDVLSALKYLADQNINIPLIIAGSADRAMINYREKLLNWVKKNELSPNVIWAGSLCESEMAWCYQNCSAFVMTSKVESFGQIALEAMNNGCQCISSDNPCLPEIFGNSAIYYKPRDEKELSLRIKEVLSRNEFDQISASQRAITRASQFSWDICAEKTVEQFVLAIEEFKRKNKG